MMLFFFYVAPEHDLTDLKVPRSVQKCQAIMADDDIVTFEHISQVSILKQYSNFYAGF